MSLLLIISGLVMVTLGILQKIYLYKKNSRESLWDNFRGKKRIYDRGYKKTRQMKSVDNSKTYIPKYAESNDKSKKPNQKSEKDIIADFNKRTIHKKLKDIKKDKKKINNTTEKNLDYSRRDIEDFKNILNESRYKLNFPALPGKYREVIALSREHKNIDEIARELDLGVRETKLILKLHQRKADINGS